jgi:hydrogenase-4 membrane subunit HyfE
VAFQFGDGARADARALTLGVIAATVVIAFLVLSTNREPVAQLVALLFMENALALFESLMPEPWPIPVHLAISGVYVGTVSVGGWLVRGAHDFSHSGVKPSENWR